MDVMAIERTNNYRGQYHVLHGSLDPMNGVGADQLKMRELFTRVANPAVQEVIVATNPTLEGDATAMYIRRAISNGNLRITYLARGLPMGGSLEYSDENTLSRALKDRRDL